MSDPPGTGSPATPDPPAERSRPSDETAAASVGELRTLRRWLLVTAVWAVAATAIAVIALVAANDESESRAAGEQAAEDIARVQNELTDRIDELESRVDELPSSEDLDRLDQRVGKVEDASSAASDSVERLSGRLDEVESGLDDLEREVARQQESARDEASP